MALFVASVRGASSRIVRDLFQGGLVGAPIFLSDLAKIDANPLVRCKRCIWFVEYDRAALIGARMRANRNTTWASFCSEARCAACGSKDVRVEIRPFVGDRTLGRGNTKEALVFKALCVLQEAQEAAKSGRGAPSYGLRFALAYLYAVGDRRSEWFDRQPYVEFWQVATQKDATGTVTDGSVRSTILQSHVNGIARAAGMEVTPAVLSDLGKATGTIWLMSEPGGKRKGRIIGFTNRKQTLVQMLADAGRLFGAGSRRDSPKVAVLWGSTFAAADGRQLLHHASDSRSIAARVAGTSEASSRNATQT